VSETLNYIRSKAASAGTGTVNVSIEELNSIHTNIAALEAERDALRERLACAVECIEETAHELGCSPDNEEMLCAIHTLKATGSAKVDVPGGARRAGEHESAALKSLRERLAETEAYNRALEESFTIGEGRCGWCRQSFETHEEAAKHSGECPKNPLRSRLAAAVDALRKYGQHLYDCDGRRHSDYACDCGFTAALAGDES